MHATQLHNASYEILPYVRYQESVPSVESAYSSTGNHINTYTLHIPLPLKRNISKTGLTA